MFVWTYVSCWVGRFPPACVSSVCVTQDMHLTRIKSISQSEFISLSCLSVYSSHCMSFCLYAPLFVCVCLTLCCLPVFISYSLSVCLSITFSWVCASLNVECSWSLRGQITNKDNELKTSHQVYVCACVFSWEGCAVVLSLSGKAWNTVSLFVWCPETLFMSRCQDTVTPVRSCLCIDEEHTPVFHARSQWECFTHRLYCHNHIVTLIECLWQERCGIIVWTALSSDLVLLVFSTQLCKVTSREK